MNLALIIPAIFILVWIISAVATASQAGKTAEREEPARRRERSEESPRVERTSTTDIDRFMAEIDRLRRRGEGPRPPEPARSLAPPRTPDQSQRTQRNNDQRAKAEERRKADRDKKQERKQRVSDRPPPIPASVEPVPVLKPIAVDLPSKHQASAPPAARAARPSAPLSSTTAASPVMQTIQAIMKDKNSRAAALVLAEVLGERKGNRRHTGRG